MRILQTLMMFLMIALLAGAPAIPHICLDDAGAAKAEQVVKSAANDHQDSSKSKDNCCVAHHCCFAKLISPAQPIGEVTFSSKAGLSITDQNHLASFDPKGLDRPPKFFA